MIHNTFRRSRNKLNEASEASGPQQGERPQAEALNKARKRPQPRLLLPFPFLIILQYKRAQSLKGRIEGFAVVGFGKCLYEAYQVGIAGNHESGDGDVELTALHGEVEAAVDDLAIHAVGILVVFLSDFEAGGFAVCDHEDLFVGVATAF